MTYLDKLQDKRWIKKRKRILKRDEYKCTVCGSKKNLQVHHTFYYSDSPDPWDYPDESLLTACRDCHLDFHLHNETEIRDRKKKKAKVLSKPKKPKKKKSKKRNKISLAEYQEIRGLRIKPRK